MGVDTGEGECELAVDTRDKVVDVETGHTL